MKEKVKKPFYKKWWFWLLAVIIIGAAASGGEEDPKEIVNTEPQSGEVEPEKTETEEESNSWEETVKSIALSDKTPTEKFDEVSMYANDYDGTDEEVNEFEEFIINEFTSGKYLSDLENHEYMLSNIFKAQVIESFYDDSEQNPKDKFAFDFLQNSKYTYRGVDAVDSESVLSNEEQMKKALEEMK